MKDSRHRVAPDTVVEKPDHKGASAGQHVTGRLRR